MTKPSIHRTSHRLRVPGRWLLVGLFFVVPAYGTPQRHVAFRYEAVVRGLPPGAKTIDVWLPVPPDTRWQKVVTLKVNAPVPGVFLTERVYGNRVWYARIPRPPDGTFRVIQRVEVIRKAGVVPLHQASTLSPATDKPRLFLKPNRLVPLTDRFKRIAAEAVGGRATGLEPSRHLYDYVLGRMTYDKTGSGWGRGDAVYACDVGRGNCTDFHSLFIALSRSVDIPARFRIGFSLPDNAHQGTVGGYHCWAEFWVSELGWVPVDISEADKNPDKKDFYFGGLDENRIAFSLGRDLVLPPGQQGPPVNYLIYPYVEVDGVPWGGVEHRFSFADRP